MIDPIYMAGIEPAPARRRKHRRTPTRPAVTPHREEREHRQSSLRSLPQGETKRHSKAVSRKPAPRLDWDGYLANLEAPSTNALNLYRRPASAAAQALIKG